jgi:hypothetical protein
MRLRVLHIPAEMERFLATLAIEGLASKTVNEFLGARRLSFAGASVRDGWRGPYSS